MKKAIYCSSSFIFIFLLYCKPSKTQQNHHLSLNPKVSGAKLPKCPQVQDSVYILNGMGEILSYHKTDFELLCDKYNRCFSDFPQHPDFAYLHDEDKAQFTTEKGQDRYYLLYAYFLKQRNGSCQFEKERKDLIEIYSNINALFSGFEYGGTYFDHQNYRILGYAEYSVALWRHHQNQGLALRDIEKQKRFYLQSLRQLVSDRNKIDFNSQKPEKEKRNQRLKQIINNLDKLIGNYFYLESAQEFQYRHYEYLGQNHAQNHHEQSVAL